MIKDSIKTVGRLVIRRYNSKNQLVQEIEHHNMIVHVGKQFIINRIVSASMTPVNHMAIGVGTTSPVSSDTGLEVEVARLPIPVPSIDDVTINFTGIFPPASGTGDITEAGLFNASSAGTMLARTSFPAVQKEAGDSIAISWYVSLS